MATESLIVELDAKTAKLDAKLKKTEDRLEKLEGKTKKTDSSFLSLSKTAKAVGVGILSVSAAALAATAVIVATSKVVAGYSRELKIASDLSGVAVEDFQLMAHATASVGIGIEKLGDISKDTREKIGDFLNTGGGGFQDFADAMRLTKSEAQSVANEFAILSGPQILQEMVTRMEAANVSAVQMSHALEGMASDTTNLIPLLADGGAKMTELKLAAASVVIPLNDDDIDLFIRMGRSTDLAAASLKSLGEQTLLNLGESFIAVTDTIAYFFATLNQGSIAQKKSRLFGIGEEIEAAQAEVIKLDNWANKLIYSEESRAEKKTVQTNAINELLKEQWTLLSDIKVLEDGAVKPDSSTVDPLKPNSEINSTSVSDIQTIADRFKDEEQLLADKLERELEMVGENKELRLALDSEYWMNVAILDQNAADKKEKIAKKADSSETKRQLSRRNSMLSIASVLAGDNEKIAKGIFIVSQGLAAADVFVNTQRASMRALADLGPIAGAPVAASIQASGYLSMASIAATTIGGLSGGGGSSGSISSADSTSTQQEVFQPETTSLELTDSSESGSQATTINFGTDSGDDLIDAIATALNKAQREGRA